MELDFKRTLFAALIVLYVSTALVAQGRAPVTLSAIDSRNCERLSAIFDSFVQGTRPDKNIIVISYLGIGEIDRNIAQERLRRAKEQLLKYYVGTPFERSPSRVIGAIGTERDEESRMDFYVDGVVGLRIFFASRVPLHISPCHSKR